MRGVRRRTRMNSLRMPYLRRDCTPPRPPPLRELRVTAQTGKTAFRLLPCTQNPAGDLMKRLLILLIVLAFVPAHAQALDTSGLRALAAMPLAVDACARSGRVPPDQLGYYSSRLNAAYLPPPLFIETVRYAPVVVQQPDFFPFVDSEISQGVVGDALVTVIEQ